MFKEELPAGLPPRCDVDIEINLFDESKPLYRGLFQLSPAELKDTEIYVTEFLNKGVIRPSRPPYGVQLFFVKHKMAFIE